MHSDREKLVAAGRRLANCAYNIAQRGEVSERERAFLREAQAEWEAALSEPVKDEPVAWQWRTIDGWHTVERPTIADPETYARKMAAEFGQVRPIYTRPAGERPAVAALREAVREALIFYENHGAGCRLVHSGGDASRHELAKDGGKRAKDALAALDRLNAMKGESDANRAD